MTSFEERAPNQANLASLPQIPPIPIPPLPNVAIQIASHSLSPNLMQAQAQKANQLQSQSLSPKPRDRKRLRESSVDDNKDTKRRKLGGVTVEVQPPHDVPPPSALMYTRPSSTDNNDNAASLNTAASNCSSISRTSPSITSSEPNQIQSALSSMNSIAANDDNKEIHLALQKIATLVAKNNKTDAPLASLLPTPQNLNNLSQLLPTQQSQNNVLSMSNSPVNNSNNDKKYKTLNLRIPNIDINSMNHMALGDSTNSQHALPGHSSADRMNQFLFGGTPPVQCNAEQNGYHNNYTPMAGAHPSQSNANGINGNNHNHSPLSTQLQNQLLVSMNAIQPNLSLHDIDNELQKEMNKREMRKIIAQQLEALRLQIYQQEREDEAKLQALKFMKLMQTTQSKQENKLALNYTAANMQTGAFIPVASPHMKPQQQPLPLPQFLQIPSFNATNLRQRTPPNDQQMFLEEQKKMIANNKTRSKITPLLSGHDAEAAEEEKSNTDENRRPLPAMSNSNEWQAVSNSDEFIQNLPGHRDWGQSKYAGHGRETIIAATGKIQPRKDMDESQCALLCNLMVELCFTEGLESKPYDDNKDAMMCAADAEKKDIKNALKIDPEICLKMNLNTNTRLNGFSSMIGETQNNHAMMHKKQSMFNIIPPTFQQTSTSMMPGLENEMMNNLSSSSDSSSSSSSSSEDECFDKFKSDSEDAPIAYRAQLLLKNESGVRMNEVHKKNESK